MKYMNEEVIPYQIPETVEEFDAMEKEVEAAVKTLFKWGIDSMTRNGGNASMTMRQNTTVKNDG